MTRPPGRRRFIVPLLGVAVLVGVAAGWSLSRAQRPGHPDPPAGALLALVGDSITAMAADDLSARGRDAGWSPVVDATPGAITREMQAAAEAEAGRHPSAAVVHLGTNDWVCAYQMQVPGHHCRVEGFTVDDRDHDLTVMARSLHDAGACVVGVIPVVDHGVGLTWRHLVDEGLADGVADWRTEAARRHDEVLADELGHLTEAGRAAYARFVLDAVARTCGQPATAP